MAAVILVFFGFVIGKVWELRAAAERLAVEQTVNAIRWSLGTEALTEAIAGRTRPLAALHHANPMELLDTDEGGTAGNDGQTAGRAEAQARTMSGPKPPPGYIGELDDPDPATIDGYQWYFDRSRGILVYRVANDGYFTSDLAGAPRIRFQLRAKYRDRNGNGRFDPDSETLERLDLIALDTYRWDL